MSHSTVVPSPDSGQPAWQPGACAVVPLTSWLSAKYTVAPDGTEPAVPVTEGVAVAWAGDAEATAVAVAAGSLAAAWLAGAGALWLAGGALEPAEPWLAHPAASTVTAVAAASVKRRVTEVIDPPIARNPECCL
jgi:hypothetical protein